MNPRIVVLGAGFGGLELSTMLSEALGDQLDLILIDRDDAFFFGFSKLDVMFGRETPDAVRLAYSRIVKPGVRFRQETITSIDPETRRVTTTIGTYEADVLVVALGADYDLAATLGLHEGGHEFYSIAGAERLRDVLPTFSKGRAIVGVTSAPFKCPPAPSEAALLLHDYLTARGVRDACEISLVIPFGDPIPPSPASSRALVAAFAERGIAFLPNRSVRALDPARRVAILDDERELPYDLFLGVPSHRVPDVVAASGLAENGWIPVDPKNLKTRFPGVYAVGDVTSVGTAKAGTFSEGAARASLPPRCWRNCRAAAAPRLTLGRVPATSSSGEAASGAWTWTFFRALRRRGASSNPPSPWSARSGTLDPVAAPAGSDHSEAFQTHSAALELLHNLSGEWLANPCMQATALRFATRRA